MWGNGGIPPRMIKGGTAIDRSIGVPRRVGGVQTPPEIPNALQNRAKLNPIVKTVKNY